MHTAVIGKLESRIAPFMRQSMTPRRRRADRNPLTTTVGRSSCPRFWINAPGELLATVATCALNPRGK